MLNGAAEAYRHLMPNQEKLSEDAAAAAVATQRQSRAKEDRSIHHTLPEGHFTARARSALHVNMANVALLQGNFSHAEQYAREALAACPNSPDALRMLLFILLRKGSTAQALDVLKRRPT
jgi:Flp pilus assembly protein TadD